jgi:sensor histidine kinase YesM
LRLIVTTAAIDSALPLRRLPTMDRIRSLYNGFGYVVALTLIESLWLTILYAVQHPQPVSTLQFARDFGLGFLYILFSALPGPFIIPPIVNLAPRFGWRRLAALLLIVIASSWWCLVLADGVHFAWNWSSLGYALDGLLTLSLVFGICAYHSYSREAADSLLRVRIGATRLGAELQRAQLQLLRAQIEPHFLFNTLSVVRALAHSDRKATVEMLDNLIHYFAAALPNLRGNEVPLAQEIQLIDAYLAIYRARMGTRLAYDIVFPEELAQVCVPSMVLLTLVENALKHGVSPNVEGGSIRISAVRENGRLRLAVADSGRGLGLRQGHGAGLANIRQRLLMLYGQDAMLSLKAAQPRGVVASILMPVSRPT